MRGEFQTAIAGSKAFALALFAPLAERLGTRPRIATDPGQAAALLPDAGLVIVEVPNAASLAAVQQLRAARPALRFVAALPRGSEAAAGPLASIGVEAVQWTGEFATLLQAVDRALGRPPSGAGPADEPTAATPEDDFEVVIDGGGPAPDPFAAGPVLSAQPGDSPTATWPGNAPSLEASEEALLAAMDRTAPPFPEVNAVALKVADALSAIEEKALARAPLEVDGTPIRRVAAMRVRVGFAFASAPPRGSSSDPAAVAALLGEIDALLTEVNAAAASAPEGIAAELGGCRNTLVKAAIDFSEVAQRYVAKETPHAVAGEGPARRRPKTSTVRVLSVQKAAEPASDARQRTMLIAVALAAALALAYHGYGYFQRRGALEDALQSQPPGTPAGYASMGTASASEPKVLRPLEGSANPAEVERFKAQEHAAGNDVVELPGGLLVVKPGGERAAPQAVPAK